MLLEPHSTPLDPDPGPARDYAERAGHRRGRARLVHRRARRAARGRPARGRGRLRPVRVAAGLDPEHRRSCGADRGTTMPGPSTRPWARPAGSADTAGEAHAIHGLALGYARSGRFADAVPAVPALAGALRDDRRPLQPGPHPRQPRLAVRAGAAPGRCAQPRHARPRPVPGGRGPARGGHGTQRHRLLPRPARRLPGRHHLLRAGAGRDPQVGERNWEAATWDSLGYIHHQLGDYQRRSRATSGPSASSGSSPTASTRPTRSTISATSSSARAMRRRPADLDARAAHLQRDRPSGRRSGPRQARGGAPRGPVAWAACQERGRYVILTVIRERPNAATGTCRRASRSRRRPTSQPGRTCRRPGSGS